MSGKDTVGDAPVELDEISDSFSQLSVSAPPQSQTPPTTKSSKRQDDTLLEQRLALVPQHIKILEDVARDVEDRKTSLIYIRKLLSTAAEPPIDRILELSEGKLVPLLVQLLKTDSIEFQAEAAWALANISSGDSSHTELVVKQGAIPLFMQVIQHTADEELKQTCVWALGNIAGDNVQYRDMVLHTPKVIDVLEELISEASVNVQRTAVWSLSNLCRGKPLPDYKLIKTVVPTIVAVLNSSNDEEVLKDALWCLSFISDYSNQAIDDILDTDVLKLVVSFLTPNSPILSPALRTIGNITTGNDTQTQQVLNCGILSIFKTLLSHQNANIRKEVCWAISNIVADNAHQILYVLRDPSNLMLKVMDILKNDETAVQKEAAWVISNALAESHPDDIQNLITHGLLAALLQCLKSSEPALVERGLQSVNDILNICVERNGMDEVVSEMLNTGIADQVSRLYESAPSPNALNLAGNIVNNYFEEAADNYDGEEDPGQTEH